MFTRAEVEKLGAFHAAQPEVLSLYLSIPSSAAEPGLLSRRVTELVPCEGIGLHEVFPLPGWQPEQAVLGVRAHIRPLLDALQQYPAAPRLRPRR